MEERNWRQGVYTIPSKSLSIKEKKARQSKLEKLVGLGVDVLFFFILANERSLNLFKNLGKNSNGASGYIIMRKH